MEIRTNNLGKVALTVEGVHDITKDYDKLSIVLNKYDGISYVSKIPVPKNIEINNTKYWMPFNISGKGLVLAATIGDSEVKAMTQKAVTDLYHAFRADVNKSIEEQKEINESLLNIGEEAKKYANMSKEEREKFNEAIKELSPDQQNALQLAVTVGIHTDQINDIYNKLGDTSFVYLSEINYQILASTGELELTPAELDDNGEIITPAVILKFDNKTTYLTYEE